MGSAAWPPGDQFFHHKSMKAIERVVREGRAFIALSLYFLFCYGTVVLLKKLILAHYHISFFGFGAAILGALISAKAVLVIECSPLSRVLDSAAPFLKVIYDCLLYTLLALLFLYLEKVLELAHKEGHLRPAFLTVGREDDLSQFFAMVLWAGLSFLGYAVFAAISRHLGPGELFRLFFTPRGKKDKHAPATAAPHPPDAS